MESKKFSYPSKRGAVELSLTYIIPIILGVLVIIFYLLFFGPGKFLGMLNKTFNTSSVVP